MLIVLTTTPDKKSAEKIGKYLVKNKLAACINILKIEKSIYRWKGKVQEAQEFLLIIKIKKSLYKKLDAKITKIHPYEVPELLSLKPEDVPKPYLNWIISSLA